MHYIYSGGLSVCCTYIIDSVCFVLLLELYAAMPDFVYKLIVWTMVNLQAYDLCVLVQTVVSYGNRWWAQLTYKLALITQRLSVGWLMLPSHSIHYRLFRGQFLQAR